MSEREDNVYKAKLAEQAERYDGEYYLSPFGTALRYFDNTSPERRPLYAILPIG